MTDLMAYVPSNATVALVQAGVVIPVHEGSCSFGSRAELTASTDVYDLSRVTVTSATVAVSNEPRTALAFSGTWDLVDQSTVRERINETMATGFSLTYTSGGITFVFPSVTTGALAQLDSAQLLSWTYLVQAQLLSFSSSHPNHLSISSLGVITHLANAHFK